MPNARLKPGETEDERRERYNREMREYRAKRATTVKPLPSGKYNYTLDKDRQFRTKYGITLEAAHQLLEAQGGVCAICAAPLLLGVPQTLTGNEAAIDHDHTTGKVRGVLCGRCNKGLGLFLDNPVSLRAAADYLLA